MTNNLNLIPLDEFMKIPPVENNWVVDQLLIESGVSLLVGSPKDGKSTFARHLMKAVSTGGSILGMQAKKGRIIYLALEEVPDELKKIFDEIQYPLEADLHILAQPLNWKARKLLETSIDEIRPALVVIDTLGRFMSLPDFNDYATVNQEFSWILNLARQYGCHIMCLHHTNKSEGIGGNRILGSNAFLGLVDNAIFIDREENYGRIGTKPRYGAAIQGRFFQYVDGNLIDAGDAKEKLVQVASQRVLETLKMSPEALPDSELVKRTQIKNQALKGALRDLVQAGSISRTGNGRKGDPYLYALNAGSR